MFENLRARITGQRQPTAQTPPAFRVVEGVSGYFSYHLARGDTIKALCDPNYRAMRTGIPLDAWGHRSHLRETYCARCEEIARAEGERGLGHRSAARGVQG